jgi:uncharacterized protein
VTGAASSWTAGQPPGDPPPLEDPAGWRLSRLREGLWVFAFAFGVLMVARYLVGPAVPFVADNLKAVAVLVFLYVPGWLAWRRGEDLARYGLTLKGWKRELAWGLGLAALIFPIFGVGFYVFVELLAHLPDPWAGWIAPYRGGFDPAFRLPPDLFYLLGIHLLVVALPEEFFYRGWLYARLAEGLDEERRGRRILGVVIGPAFWLTAVLFAVGHLTEPYPWRLAVFFPALVFAWLRLKTGGLLAPIVFHGLSNVFIAILEASFFPR